MLSASYILPGSLLYLYVTSVESYCPFLHVCKTVVSETWKLENKCELLRTLTHKGKISV